MSQHLDQLRAVVEAAVPHSAGRFWWLGVLSEDVAEHLRPLVELRQDVARSHLAGNLANRLYEDFYQRGGAQPSRASYAGSPRAGGARAFVDELSAANCGAGTQQAGWVVVSVDGEALSIRREGLTLRTALGEVDHRGPGLPIAGDGVALKLPKELPALSPGFYTALSDEPYRPEGRQVVRLYWNLYPWGAAPLVREITMRLNHARLPFRLKVANHPDRYTRCDAAVLYLIKDDLPAAIPLLEGVHTEIASHLKQPVPALTRRIAPGVGLAEDPPDGDSFGLQRCRLLASGLVRAWEQGAETVDERLALVIEHFAGAGIDVARPWLNPGSEDGYEFTFEPRVRAAVSQSRRTESDTFERDCLQVAVQIGEEICREAVWHKGRCNWLGVVGRNRNAPAHEGMTYASLGPEPYGGTSGVALFLAELAAATGDEDARRTALGAIHHALDRAGEIEPPVHLGLYTGLPGLALVATRVGTLLGAGDVLDGARGVLGSVTEVGQGGPAGRPYGETAGSCEHDLLGGEAGGIVALLRLREMSGDDALFAAAIRLGDRLIGAAVRDGAGCSWASLTVPGSPNLTGLSHGAAGIGMALLELWSASGEDRYREVAEQAFAFERSWFDARRGNWPDFRQVAWRDERPVGPFPYPAYWCHGAPGIALSRLRAWELTGDPAYRDEAITALDTTERAAREALADGTMNFSLCHGLAGNAEILSLGSKALGEGCEHYAGTARSVAQAGIDVYSPAGRSWPLGAHGGWTPNLMLGLAGVGRFYLRLADLALPSILLWRDAGEIVSS